MPAQTPSKVFRKDDYTIGWIAAVPGVEDRVAVFDQKHDDISIAGRAYSYGSIGDHNVVKVCLSQQQGIRSTTTVLEQLTSDFPNLRYVFLVGIAGGIPLQEPEDAAQRSTSFRGYDVRLGDVVISSPSKKLNAVEQYDFGRETQGARFEHNRSNIGNPPEELQQFVDRFLDDIPGKGKMGDLIQKEIKDTLNVDGQDEYRRPDKETDILYKSDITKYNVDYQKETETDIPDDWVINRSRQPIDKPLVFKGTILSGNRVMKDAIRRDELARSFGSDALAIDMESAGLHADVRWLVVRGICDYADSHKVKPWQPYAAAAAAAYTRLLLRHIKSKHIEEAIESEKARDNEPHSVSGINNRGDHNQNSQYNGVNTVSDRAVLGNGNTSYFGDNSGNSHTNTTTQNVRNNHGAVVGTNDKEINITNNVPRERRRGFNY